METYGEFMNTVTPWLLIKFDFKDRVCIKLLKVNFNL